MGPARLIVPLLVIAIGIAWLLNTLEIMPGVDWLWSGGLALAGVLTFALGGVDRFTIVVGPFLIAASIASVLRQTGRIHIDHEIPGLVIVLGILMLIAQLVNVPSPGWGAASIR